MQTTAHTGAGRKEAKGPSQPRSAHWGAGRACNGAINSQQGPESMTVRSRVSKREHLRQEPPAGRLSKLRTETWH